MARDRRNAESWNHATSFQDVAGIAASARCVEVLWAVLHHPRSVKILSEDLKLPESSVSHCLGQLTRAGLATFDGHERRRDYRASERVAAHRRGDRVELVLRSSEGTNLELDLSPNMIASLSREDRAVSEVPAVAVRPVAVPAPPGGVPTDPRPASAPG